MPENPLYGGPVEVWHGSPLQPVYPRADLGAQIRAARQPDRYVHGDALYGWTISDTPPSFENLSWGRQNFLRARLNDLENPRGLLGDNQQYINEVQDLIDKGRGEFNAWKNSGDALKNLIPFTSSIEDDLAPVLEQVDPDFDGMVEWNEWSKQNPEVARYLTDVRGFRPEERVAGARNRDAFMLSINLEMTKAQIQQEIDEYEQQAGTFESWSQFLGGGAIRQFYMDSDAAKTLGLSGIARGVGLTAGALRGSRFVSLVPKLERPLELAARAGTPVASVHNVLSKNLRLGTAGALAVEGAVTGALWDVQHQRGMQEMAEFLGSQPLDYDFGDTFKAGGLGALFGLGMYGAIRAVGALGNRLVDKPSAVQQALKTVGLDDSPLARHGLTPEGLTLQALEEDGITRINRLLGEAVDDRLGFLLSKDVIEASGRTVSEVGQFVDQIMVLRQKGIRMPDAAVVEAIDDFLGQGTLQHLTAAERAKVEAEMAREALLEMRQRDPKWRAVQERNLANWMSARQAAARLADDQVLDKAIIDQVLGDAKVRIKSEAATRITVAQLRQHIEDQIAQIDNLLNRPADVRGAMKEALKDNPIAAAVIDAAGFRPKSAAGRLMADIHDKLVLIDEQLRLGGKGSKTAVKAAREEIKRLSQSLTRLYGKTEARPRRNTRKPKAPSAKTLDRLPPDQQTKVIGDIIEKLESSPNEVMEGTSLMNKALRAIGYTGPIQRVLLDRTGIYTTARSLVKSMRELSGLFGSPDYNARVFAGRGGAGVGVIAAMGRASRDVQPIKSFLEEIANLRGMSDEAFADFHRTVESALNRKARMPAGHRFEKEGNKLIDMWSRYVEETLERGLRTRSLRRTKETKVSTFLPLIANEPMIRKHFNEAVQDLARVWQRLAQESDHLNPEYLESLGWIERPVDRWGNRVGKVIYKDNAPINPAWLQGDRKGWPRRSDLTPEGLKQYEAALQSHAPLEGAAATYWTRFLREDGRATDVRTINDKVYGSNGRNPHKRKITQLMLERFPELKRYFNRDLFTMADRYAKTVGFKAHVGESIQRQFGINATLGQIMNALEAKMKYEARQIPDLAKEIEVGFDKYHEMIAWLTDNLPNTDPTYSVASRYTFDFISKVAALPVMGGLGMANSAEAMVRMFTMVHSPADLGRNMRAFIRGLFANRSILREEMAGMSQDLRRLAVGYAHQLQSGRVDHAYELTTRGVLTRPWKDAWNIATGKTRHGQYPNRAAATAIATLDALGKNAYVMGGGPRIQHATEVMIAGAANREFMRYAEALIKLRQLMEQNPIDPTDTQAAHKAFVGLARKAGFGDRWDVAQRFLRYDLGEPGIVEALLDAAKQVPDVRNKLHVRANDLLEVYAKMPPGKQRDVLYEAIQRHNQYVDERIMEELGEVSAWTARTDRRSPQGRALDLFTNYIHNIYFYKLAKSSSMPSRVFLGVVTGFVMSELIQKIVQDYLQGATQEEMLREWNTPVEAMTSALSVAMRMPMFGSVSFIPKSVVDMALDAFNRATGNDPINAYTPKFGGVVGSAVDGLYRLGRGASTWAFALTPEQEDRGRRMFINSGIRYLPVINSLYGKTAVRMFTDWKQRANTRGSLRVLDPVGDGRSIWGDEDLPDAPPSDPTAPRSGFDLHEALSGGNN